MAATLSEVADQIINTLRVTDPELDTSVGTSTRKIIDAVAYTVANAYVDQHMTSYQYDIDSKAGSDLDSFTQLFGIARLVPKRASGAITFQRLGAGDVTVTIPAGTEISTLGSPAIVAVTIVTASMSPGQNSVSIPVQAVRPGVDGNVAAGSLVQLISPVINVTGITNPLPLSGGTNPESDTELRARWKSTVFRSLAGTEQMYRGIALADANCTSATVLGSSKRRRERLQVEDDNTAVSQVPDASYVFASGTFVGPDLAAGNVASKGLDYTWNATTPYPSLSGISATRMPPGSIIDLDFEYISKASRNNPTAGIASKVDIWVAGTRRKSASQTLVWKATMPTFNTTPGSPYNVNNFKGVDGTPPASGNVFVPLAFGPIVSVPEAITWGAKTYGRRGVTPAGGIVTDAYRIVHDVTVNGLTPVSLFGLEMLAGAVGYAPPATGNTVTIGSNNDYVYNEVPASVQVEVDRWRLVGIDALVHQGIDRALRFNLAIMYDGTRTQNDVNIAIDTAISTYLVQRGMGSVIQVSDVLRAVSNVPGVDAVRFLEGSDVPAYNNSIRNGYQIGIQLVEGGSVTYTYVTSTGRPQDATMSDNHNPIFEWAYKEVRAQNTFGG